MSHRSVLLRSYGNGYWHSSFATSTCTVLVLFLFWSGPTIRNFTVDCFPLSLVVHRRLSIRTTRRVDSPPKMMRRHLPTILMGEERTKTTTTTRIASAGAAHNDASRSDDHWPEQEYDNVDDRRIQGATGPSEPNHLQLWLDLRTTSIAPLAALLHLTDDLWEEYTPRPGKSFLVDKVVLGSKRRLDLNSIAEDIRQEFDTEIGILVVDDDRLLEMDPEGASLKQVGTVIQVESNRDGITNININPLPVLDRVLKGEWVFLDIKENVDLAAITQLMELVTSSVGVGGTVLNLDGKEPSSPGTSPTGGGMGLLCSASSPSSVIEMGAMIQSLNGGRGYKTTESGILVQETVQGLEEETGVMDGSLMNFAVVMPLDASLWKTASFLFGTSTTTSSSLAN